MSDYVTRFGSLDSYTKGGVEIIDDDPKHYTFSNIFEVASKAKPYQKIAVAKNIQYVVEVQRAEGTPAGLAAPSVVPSGTDGSIRLAGKPEGKPMGTVKARRGHLTLLPAGAAYQFQADRPGVILLQTVAGKDTEFRWAEICQTSSRNVPFSVA